ncbi:hypothetical protein SAMN05428953_101553 [Mesorhizobium muleiense]|uniref:Uncharacterized protein n=2 Tax=Mesorhizobium muleiense TaxID=1004279 RepID=A0A1G8J131_9HYPH|nr:hypothetical protein SAMN05428953_101553 [Mesorhizobium muleiense]
MALRRPMPESLTYGDSRNNNFQIRIGGDQNDGFRFIPKVIVDEGVEGWYFADNEKKTDACLPNRQLNKLQFKVIHHYKGLRIGTESPGLFIVQQFASHSFFAAWAGRFRQFFFNRRRLARQDRMAILRYIFDRTVQKADFKTSSIDLPAQIYGMRFFGRDDHDSHLEYYQIVLDSLLDSGDLRRDDHSYALSSKAVATLDAHETDVERHKDNIGMQRRIVVIYYSGTCRIGRRTGCGDDLGRASSRPTGVEPHPHQLTPAISLPFLAVESDLGLLQTESALPAYCNCCILRSMFTQDQAKQMIFDRWRALPIDDRRTDRQAAEFAMKIRDDYPFRCKGDRYQVVKGWLQNYLARSS